MDQIDLELLKVAQDGVKLTERPYREWGETLGITEEEVIDRLRDLELDGTPRSCGGDGRALCRVS
jgi:DNA-binding Lrp family transcriptional regulator